MLDVLCLVWQAAAELYGRRVQKGLTRGGGGFQRSLGEDGIDAHLLRRAHECGGACAAEGRKNKEIVFWL